MVRIPYNPPGHTQTQPDGRATGLWPTAPGSGEIRPSNPPDNSAQTARGTGVDCGVMDSRTLAVMVAGYALGCLNAGYYLVRTRTGDDIRRFGSGATGATNAGRLLGRSAFAVTFGLDCAKGIAAAAVALVLGLSPWPAAAAAVVGHIWPIQLGFKGGKGVATLLGALLVADPGTVLLGVVLFLPAFALLRRFEVAGLAALALMPPARLLMGRPLSSTLWLSLIVIIVLAAHRANLAWEWHRRRTRRPDRTAR
jgi:acyl phosphate:glycerol-3-phosphate acyltransferase